VGDWEPFAGMLSAVASLVTWAPWYGDIFRVNRLAASRSHRIVLALMPVACLVFLLLCLETSAAKAVRASSFYTAIYMALGAAELGVASHLFSFLGISPRDDVLERRNGPALIAVVGAQLGTMLCFAGGNIGEGPGVEAVVLSAGTALCVWFLLWYSADLLSGRLIAERISVERDTGCGVRLAGLLVGNSLILGAAAAWEWKPDRFLHDFGFSAWPALILTCAAILVEKFVKSRSSLTRSIVTSLGYLVVAFVWVLHRGLEA
jgi:hypothetical protein